MWCHMTCHVTSITTTSHLGPPTPGQPNLVPTLLPSPVPCTPPPISATARGLGTPTSTPQGLEQGSILTQSPLSTPPVSSSTLCTVLAASSAGTCTPYHHSIPSDVSAHRRAVPVLVVMGTGVVPRHLPLMAPSPRCPTKMSTPTSLSPSTNRMASLTRYRLWRTRNPGHTTLMMSGHVTQTKRETLTSGRAHRVLVLLRVGVVVATNSYPLRLHGA